MKTIALLVVCLLAFALSDSFGQDFIITNKIPKTPKVNPQPLPIPGASIDWGKLGSLPQRPKVTTYGASWCVPCKVSHGYQIEHQKTDNRRFEWEFIDLGNEPLPEWIRSKTNSIPCTIIEGFDPIPGVITSGLIEKYLKRSAGYGSLFSPMTIGTISRKAVGLSQTGNQTSLSMGGANMTFPTLTPSMTFDPPASTGSGSIKVDITKVRLTSTQAILTAKGLPVEFALDLIP